MCGCNRPPSIRQALTTEDMEHPSTRISNCGCNLAPVQTSGQGRMHSQVSQTREAQGIVMNAARSSRSLETQWFRHTCKRTGKAKRQHGRLSEKPAAGISTTPLHTTQDDCRHRYTHTHTHSSLAFGILLYTISHTCARASTRLRAQQPASQFHMPTRQQGRAKFGKKACRHARAPHAQD